MDMRILEAANEIGCQVSELLRSGCRDEAVHTVYRKMEAARWAAMKNDREAARNALSAAASIVAYAKPRLGAKLDGLADAVGVALARAS